MAETKTATEAPKVDKKSDEYGASEFKAMAQVYHENKLIVDACAKSYDNVDDAIAGLKKAWAIVAVAADQGAGHTPKGIEGFGSESAQVIAEGIRGDRKTIGSIRKALNAHGK